MKIRIIQYITYSTIVVFGLICFVTCGNYTIKNANPVNHQPVIEPDYTDIIIPPNIAPLNFMIREMGTRFYVKISSEQGEPIIISSSKAKIQIPINSWRKLLNANAGKEMKWEIATTDEKGQWKQFQPILNQIATEKIDSHLAYRLLHPASSLWNRLGIYQRNLENYQEKPILINRMTENNCMNCHNFCQNDPNKMVMHLRVGDAGGTLISNNRKVIKVNTATEFNKAGAYPSWHPNGKLIAFSVNKLSMFFHATGDCRDVLDQASDVIIYDIDANMVTTSPRLANPNYLETFPAWTPDGRYLYFCRANKMESYSNYDQIRYDLVRIPYNPDDKTWGEVETLVSSAETGQSITEPRVSPDNRFLLFTMAAYGNFPVYMKSSDVYLMDLSTRKYAKYDIDSDQTDSFHSWSSNSRWFVFSSKRDDGLTARPYFSFVDESGKAHKPFILPQEDPEFYGTTLTTYNVPELIKGPVVVRPQELRDVAYNNKAKLNAKLDPDVKPHETTVVKEAKDQPAPQ
jgi:hypothetical protein